MRITNYEILATSTADLFNDNLPTGALGGIMLASLITLWSIRLALYSFLNNPQFTLPDYITAETIEYLKNLHLFSSDFLSGLTLNSINPFTPEVLAQMRAELCAGDAILLDGQLHLIVGELPMTVEQIIAQVNLLYIL